MKKVYFVYLALFLVSLVINFLWELSHAGLYQWLGPMELTTTHLLWFSIKDAVEIEE